MLKHLFLIAKPLITVTTEISAENVSLSQVLLTPTKLRKEKNGKEEQRQNQILDEHRQMSKPYLSVCPLKNHLPQGRGK